MLERTIHSYQKPRHEVAEVIAALIELAHEIREFQQARRKN